MPPRGTLVALALAFAMPASAELTPAELAAIQHDEQRATDAVAKQHGDKLPSEMTNEERAAVIHEQQAASQAVLDEHGVDAKEYARAMATLNLDERKQLEEATKAIEAKEKADAAAKACKDKGEDCPPAEPEITRGLGDEDPVVVDEDPEEPTVENLAAEPDPATAASGDSAPPAPAPPPSKGKASKHGAKHGKH